MLNLNQCPQGDDFHSDITGGSNHEEQQTDAGKETGKKKRTRRTKEQIEADRRAASGETDNNLPPVPVPGSLERSADGVSQATLECLGLGVQCAKLRVQFGGQVYVITIEPEHAEEG